MEISEWKQHFTLNWYDNPKTPEPWEIKALRSKMNLNQGKFADAFGVSMSLAAKWETCVRKMERKDKIKFAKMWWDVCKILEEDPNADFSRFGTIPIRKHKPKKKWYCDLKTMKYPQEDQLSD